MKKVILLALATSSVAFGKMQVENFGFNGLETNIQARYINHKDNDYAKLNEDLIFLENSKKDIFTKDTDIGLEGKTNIYIDYIRINKVNNFGGGLNYIQHNDEFLYGAGVGLYSATKGHKGLVNLYVGYEGQEEESKFLFNPYFFLSKNSKREKKDIGVNVRYTDKIDNEVLEELRYEIGGTYNTDIKNKNREKNIKEKKNEYVTTDIALSNSNTFLIQNMDIKVKEKITYDYKFKDKTKQLDKDRVGLAVGVELQKGNINYGVEAEIRKVLNNSNYEYATTFKVNYKF